MAFNYDADAGAWGVGGYQHYFKTLENYNYTMEVAQELRTAGFFQDDELLYFGLTIVNFNPVNQQAGFHICEFYVGPEGTNFKYQSCTFYAMQPMQYNKLNSYEIFLIVVKFIIVSNLVFLGFLWLARMIKHLRNIMITK